MTLYDLTAGDYILIRLRGNSRAVPVYQKSQKNLYKTDKNSNRHEPDSLLEAEGTIISNSNKVLTMNFVSTVNRNKTGIAEIDYISIASVYLFEGETTRPFAEASEPGTGRVPLNVYRTKVKVEW
jgi:hypothetical protein